MTALFISIGGTALALPGQNSVNSGDVRNETLRSQDLKDDAAVQSSDVIDQSLVSFDLATNSVGPTEVQNDIIRTEEIIDSEVAAIDLAPDSVGASEIGGGAVGHGDLAQIQSVAGPLHDFGNQNEGNGEYEYGQSTATCPDGWTVISGGGLFFGPEMGGGTPGTELQAVHESFRDGNGWTAIGASDVDNQDFRAVAYCLAAGT